MKLMNIRAPVDNSSIQCDKSIRSECDIENVDERLKASPKSFSPQTHIASSILYWSLKPA